MRPPRPWRPHWGESEQKEFFRSDYTGSYTVLKRLLRRVRPPKAPAFEHRFETPAGLQAQVDFAEFRVEFTAEPG